MQSKNKPVGIVSSDNIAIKDLSETIKNPNLLIMASGNWSLVQSKIVESILKQVQTQINEKISKNDMGYFIDPSFVENGLVSFTIPIKELGIPAQKYFELEGACDAITSLKSIQKKLNPITGEYEKEWDVIFIKAKIPTTNVTAEGAEISYKSGIRKKGSLTVSMHQETATDLFNLHEGYTEHLFGIPGKCRSPRTPRFYVLLSSKKRFGSYSFPYYELKEWCGLAKFNKQRTKIIEDKYPKYSEFARCVLAPCEKELKKLADKGQVDFYFEYKPVYEGERRTGNPKAVLFTIINTELGVENARNKFLNNVYHRLISIVELTNQEWEIILPLLEGRSEQEINSQLKETLEKTKKYNPNVPHAFVTRQLVSAFSKTSTYYTEYTEIIENEESKPLVYYQSSHEDYHILCKLVKKGDTWARDVLDKKEQSGTEEYVEKLKMHIEEYDISI